MVHIFEKKTVEIKFWVISGGGLKCALKSPAVERESEFLDRSALDSWPAWQPYVKNKGERVCFKN